MGLVAIKEIYGILLSELQLTATGESRNPMVRYRDRMAREVRILSPNSKSCT